MTEDRYGPRPGVGARFYKAHGLGNDYLVFEEGAAWTPTPSAVGRVCDRWKGVGADGIVVLLKDRSKSTFRLRMFNPDGSEFERSGNGLRILASYLSRSGEVGSQPFAVEVGGDGVTMTLHGREGSIFDVSVDMGLAEVGTSAVGLDASALLSPDHIEGPSGLPVRVVPVSMGNPHLVVLVEEPTQEVLLELGPFLATHPALAAGANVQLAALSGRGRMRTLIWERGVGPTRASGTSACAVAVAALSADLTRPGPVEIQMEGGSFTVSVSEDRHVVLRGPVKEVCEGTLAPAFVAALSE